jgi:TATA-box binding protein (TBP) (component of TFIID and TFIIIB)
MIAEKWSKILYEPEVFPGIIYQNLDPKTTVIVFASGKIADMGCRSEELARDVIRSVIIEIGKTEKRIFPLVPLLRKMSL